MARAEQKAYDHNLLMIGELQPRVQWAARGFLDACWFRGLYFRITEAYRSQDRQNDLYAQGRWKPGAIVTNSLNSEHTKRLAIDVRPIPGGYGDYEAYRQLEQVAAMFGITHPLIWDKPHFEFHQVGDPPQPILPYATQLAQVVKAIWRYVMRKKELSEAEKARLRMLERKEDRLTILIEEEK